MNFFVKKVHLSVIKKYLTYIGFFVSGALIPVLANSILNNQYKWNNGLTLQFNKPWFITWGNFIGLALFFIPVAIKSKCFKEETTMNWNLFRACSLSGLCLMLSTILSMYSLFYLPPSIWKIIQFFGLLFTTLIGNGVNPNRSILLDWTGLFIIFIGLVIAGASVLFQDKFYEDNNPTKLFFSIIFMIFAELVKSGQTKIEEIILHESNASTYDILACEGAWGFFFVTFIFMPLTMISSPTAGMIIYENTIESFEIMGKNWELPLVWIILIGIVAFYNWVGTLVIEDSDARLRNTFDAAMPIFVWLLAVIAHYITGESSVGESVNYATISEIIGFIICICGALIYNKILKVPCITYIQTEDTDPLGPNQANAEQEDNQEGTPAAEENQEELDKDPINENEMELSPL